MTSVLQIFVHSRAMQGGFKGGFKTWFRHVKFWQIAGEDPQMPQNPPLGKILDPPCCVYNEQRVSVCPRLLQLVQQLFLPKVWRKHSTWYCCPIQWWSLESWQTSTISVCSSALTIVWYIVWETLIVGVSATVWWSRNASCHQCGWVMDMQLTRHFHMKTLKHTQVIISRERGACTVYNLYDVKYPTCTGKTHGTRLRQFALLHYRVFALKPRKSKNSTKWKHGDYVKVWKFDVTTWKLGRAKFFQENLTNPHKFYRLFHNVFALLRRFCFMFSCGWVFLFSLSSFLGQRKNSIKRQLDNATTRMASYDHHKPEVTPESCVCKTTEIII